MKSPISCDLVVLGGGPGGYSAAFHAADLGLDTVLVERAPALGGVCLNEGCIPSKALLHVAHAMEEARGLAEVGVAFDAPALDLHKLRAHKAGVIARLTRGLSGLAQDRKVRVIRGRGSFLGASHLEVALIRHEGQDETGEKEVLRFGQCIIAAGSEAVRLPFMPQDSRVLDSRAALELESVPRRMLVVGGGIIGLEMATVYSALGARIDLVEMQKGLIPGADRDLVKVWSRVNAHRFDKVMLGTRTVGAEARADGIWVRLEGENVLPEDQRYDAVLVAVGRRPNGKNVAAEKAGIQVDANGFISVDAQMRTNVPNIFAAGDIVGLPMLAHKATHQAKIAAEAAARRKTCFDCRQIPSVAYTDPEIAWAGLTEEEAQAKGIPYGKAVFPWAASGRAVANRRDEGLTKLLFEPATHRLLGGGIAGTQAGDLIGEICLALEMGCDAEDLGETIHPHPTLCETVGLAAQVAEGICAELPRSHLPASPRRRASV